jgi:hypothetical protein
MIFILIDCHLVNKRIEQLFNNTSLESNTSKGLKRNLINSPVPVSNEYISESQIHINQQSEHTFDTVDVCDSIQKRKCSELSNQRDPVLISTTNSSIKASKSFESNFVFDEQKSNNLEEEQIKSKNSFYLIDLLVEELLSI